VCFFYNPSFFFGVGNGNHLCEGRGQEIERGKKSNQKIKGDIFGILSPFSYHTFPMIFLHNVQINNPSEWCENQCMGSRHETRKIRRARNCGLQGARGGPLG